MEPHGERKRALEEELDSICQELYGVVAALHGHRRRAHRPDSRSAHELHWVEQQLMQLHRRICGTGRQR